MIIATFIQMFEQWSSKTHVDTHLHVFSKERSCDMEKYTDMQLSDTYTSYCAVAVNQSFIEQARAEHLKEQDIHFPMAHTGGNIYKSAVYVVKKVTAGGQIHQIYAWVYYLQLNLWFIYLH